jgi:hypothetical protein
MVRFTKSWLIGVVALGFVVGAACDKGGNKAGGGGGDDVSLIPADSEMVIGLNFAQLKQSALWKQFGPKIMDQASGKLTEFKAACGFDPVDAFKSMTIGFKNLNDAPGAKPDGVIVVKGPEKSKVMPCMDKYKAEAAKQGTEISVDGDVVLFKDKDGSTAAMTFVNDTTMIAAVGTQGTKDGVKAAAKGGNSLKSSQAFNEMYSKINTGDSLWIMVNGNSPLLDKAAMLGGKPKAVYGSLNVTDGLAVDLHIREATADAAKSLVDLAKGQTDNPQVKQMVDKLDISNNGDDAHFVVAMSQQKLQALISQFGGMLGMMGGGLGQ